MKISRSTLYSWHSWLGLVTGLFMIAIGFSGAMVVFAHEIDWLTIPAVRASPSASPGTPETLDDAVEAARSRFPGGRLQSLKIHDGPRSTHVAGMTDSAGKRYQVYLDPYTGAVRGQTLRAGNTSSLSTFLTNLHTRLLISGWGRWLVGFFGVALFLSCLTGLYVYRNWIKSLFKLRFGKGWRIMTSDLHKLVGIWSLVFNLGIAGTGAVLGLEGLYNDIRHEWFGAKRPKPPVLALDPVAPGDSSRPVPPSRLLEIASATFPEMWIRSVQFPAKPGQAVMVRGDHPGGFTETGQSRVYVDPHSGRVLRAENAHEVGIGTRIYDAIEPLHYGYFGLEYGPFVEYGVKGLWLLLGLTPGLLAMSGAYLWWTRGKPKRRSSAGPGGASNRSPPEPVFTEKASQEIPHAS